MRCVNVVFYSKIGSESLGLIFNKNLFSFARILIQRVLFDSASRTSLASDRNRSDRR